MENNTNLIESDILCQTITTKEEYLKTKKQIEKDYNANYYAGHRDYFKEYYRKYYIRNKEKIDKRSANWMEENEGDYIYFHKNKNGQNLYIGSTSTALVYRQSFHLHGHSNINMTIEEYIEKYNFSNIFYKNFTKYDLSRDDLYYLESYFKEKEGQILDGKKVPYKEEELTRSKEELQNIGEAEQYQVFDLDKYLD